VGGGAVAKIFISYSKPDRELAVHLAKVLEDAGHSVWWDRELVGGDEFRTEILARLRESTHVIVLWTRNSVRSTWVHDEADEAKAAGRLVPVFHPDIEHRDIPLGFRHLQLVPIHDTEGILRSIRGGEGLAAIGDLKPNEPPSLFWKIFRNPMLYVALTTALVAYVVVPGFLAGIVLGLLAALLLIVWAAN
jgi:hypothetical protein